MLEARCLLAITSTTPIPITVTEVLSFTDTVMHFTANDLGPFTATIAWGDTNTSPGTITPSAGGGFDVSGTHTYAEDGSDTVTVLITDTADGDTVAPTTTATIGEQSLSLTAENFSVPENSSAPVLVATASDPGSPDPGSDFTSTINWGDGSAPTAGTVTATGGGNFNITGSHVYADEGTHTVTTTFFETSQAAFGTVSASGTGTVTEADVLNNGVITLPSGVFVEGQAIPTTTQVATFSDPGYPTNSASDFNALINWGDGTAPTAGTVVALGGGDFAVQGGHTYKEEGPYTLAVLVTDNAPGTASLTITGTVDILNAPLTGTAVTLHGTEGAPLTNVDVATFVDADPLGDPNDMVATINWGDGTVTAGTVVQDAQIPPGGGTMFHVEGSHTYTEELAATYPVTVTITDRGDDDSLPLDSPFVSTTTVASTAQIVQSPLLPVANSLVSTEGTPIPAGTHLATFTDTGGADPIGDYTATLNWGDGSGVHPAGVIALGQGNFAVVSNGAFTYPDEGRFALTIAVTDADTTNNPGGVPTTAETTAAVTVNDAALTAGAAVALTPNTGVPLPATTVVGNFTDANTTAPATDFTAVIDWGDGSPNSLGTVVSTGGGGFSVEGGHTYAKFGSYITTINVVDDGGSRVTLVGSATVTDLPVTGAVRNFTATEGQNTGTIVLATFEDPNTLATVADVTATLPIGGWGDGTPTAVARLAVVQIGVDPANGEPIFQVTGQHTYAEEGTFTVNINVTTLGGVTTALTPGTATVIDARLTSSNGPEITGIEGTATAATTLLGTFTDANQGATVADFTTAPGSVVVNWGDGSAPQTLTAANLAAVGTPDGVIFTVTAGHTYTEAGAFAYSVTVTDDGGSVTTFIGSAFIGDATLTPSATQPVVNTMEAVLFPVPVFAPTVFKGAVASFTDNNPGATTGDFTTQIDWGDGTPPTYGTVTQPGGAGTAFIVSGSHTYADSGVNGGTGTFAIQVFVINDDGSRLTIANTANVLDKAIVLTGQLNPTSDSGLSTGTPNVTNVVQPNFFGTSEPFSHVTLFETPSSGGAPVQIGQVQAGSDGHWSITSGVGLADGHYTITATAIDQFGVTTTAAPVTIDSNLLIDTHGPVITGAFFNRLNGQVDFTIKDPAPASGGAPSGVWLNSILDAANYQLSKVHSEQNVPGKFVVTNITATPDPTIPFAYDVAVTFNRGRVLKGGFYLFTIRDTSSGRASVQDKAENHLDGEFYGTFPSGNGINGGDFVAELQAFHNKVFAPQSIIGTASPANGGAGGAQTNGIHSGVFVPVVPVGGSPIFSTPTSVSTGDPPAAHGKKGKHSVVVKHGHHEARRTVDPSHGRARSAVFSKHHPRGPLAG
jgi:hypothetical protein